MPLKDKNTVTALVGCLILVIGILYGYSAYFYGPIKQEIKKNQSEITDLERRLQVAKDRAQQLSKMQQEMASLQVDVAQLEKQLPKDRELPALIRVLTHRAESYGLVLGSVAPQRAVSKGLYDEIPYNVSVTTSFHSLGHFLASLGKGDRLFAARNLALSPNSNKADPSKTVNATFQLIAFKYHG
jgi:type IV pilus assembly protein PilO